MKQHCGQSLLEVIVAIAVFGMAAAFIGSIIRDALAVNIDGGEYNKALYRLAEGVEAVRSIRDNAWNELVINQSGLSDAIGEWTFLGEGTTEQFDGFSRVVTLQSVCRDSARAIVSCPGLNTDPHTKTVTVTISWQGWTGIAKLLTQTLNLTNWRSRGWVEDVTADFGDGVFTNTALSTTLGDSDGAVVLATQ